MSTEWPVNCGKWDPISLYHQLVFLNNHHGHPFQVCRWSVDIHLIPLDDLRPFMDSRLPYRSTLDASLSVHVQVVFRVSSCSPVWQCYNKQPGAFSLPVTPPCAREGFLKSKVGVSAYSNGYWKVSLQRNSNRVLGWNSVFEFSCLVLPPE